LVNPKITIFDTEDELTFMKSALGQRDALLYETGIQKAGFIGRMQRYNLPANYVDEQNKILANLTKADVDKLAAKWIKPESMSILLVGDKATILPGLQNLNYEIVELDAKGNLKNGSESLNKEKLNKIK